MLYSTVPTAYLAEYSLVIQATKFKLKINREFGYQYFYLSLIFAQIINSLLHICDTYYPN